MGADLILKKDNVKIDFGRVNQYFKKGVIDKDIDVTDKINKLEDDFYKRLLEMFIVINNAVGIEREEKLEELGNLSQAFSFDCFKLGQLDTVLDLLNDGWMPHISK